MILFGTGHRPEDCESEAIVRRKIRNALEELRPRTVITGMAAGFDLWFGLEAIDYGTNLWAYKPWVGHKANKGDERVYAYLIERANKVVNVNEAESYPGPWVYHDRNHAMVDAADEGLAYWNGKKSGGTYNCMLYARAIEKDVTNCYE